MTRLCIIVPTIGSQHDIDETLVSVLENRPQDCQIVVAHTARYVDPYDLGDEVEFVSSVQADIPSLCNAALEAARADVIHYLIPGMTVSAGWSDLAAVQFSKNRNIGSVIPVIQPVEGGRAVYGVAHHPRCGKRVVVSAPRPQAVPLLGTGFFRAAAIRFMHGYDCRFEHLADVELGLRMRAAGYEHHVNEEIRVSAKSELLCHRPRTGYRGGELRARLLQLACDHGFARPNSKLRMVFGELLNNCFRPSTIASLAGRAAARKHHRVPTIHALRPATPSEPRPSRHRRAA